MSDDLVTGARQGDEQAWAQLYAQHARRLVIWLQTLPSGDEAAGSAEDIAHDAWVTAAEKIGDFRGGDDEFAGWLFAISRNHSVNSHRKATRRATHPSGEQLDDAAWDVASDPATGVLGHGHVRWLLEQLSRREAEVVACIDVVGLDVASTSRALGVSRVAVRVARHRGLGRLRSLLDEEQPSVQTVTLVEPE